MHFDFGALPPEIHSTRMYSGPGASSMLAAASAWNGLAAELRSTAGDFHTVVTRLHRDEWVGPASTSMADAVAPYAAWMRATAVRAEEAATHARLAASAYETAFAAVVPPPLIAANRAQLMSLVAANVLGQNTAAIAAIEAKYGEMWAQDVAAMYQYAGASATASMVTPFAEPPPIANPAANPAAAAAAGAAQTNLGRVISQVPQALRNMASPVSRPMSSGTSSTPKRPLERWLTWYEPFESFLYDTIGLPYFGLGMANSALSSANALQGLIPSAATGAGTAASAAANDLGALLSAGHVSAAMGTAPAIGKLSVPAPWAQAGPALRPLAAPLRVSNVIEPPESGMPGNLLGGMPLAGSGAGPAGTGPRYGVRLTVMARPPCAG